MIYKIFSPKIRGTKRWGYWFMENGKKRRVFIHPKTKVPFKTKKDVEIWLRQLDREGTSYTTTIGEFSKYFFHPDGTYASRRAAQREQELSPSTLKEHERILKEYIIPDWGKIRFGDLYAQDLEDWLYQLNSPDDKPLSNRYRRNIAGTFNLILKEAERKRVVQIAPRIALPSKKAGKKDVLSLDQLKTLFPDNTEDLRYIWRNANSSTEPDNAWLMFAALNSCMFLGGLRPQEARAVHDDQVVLHLATILITRSMSVQNDIKEYLKMGNETDPRYRFTILPDRGLKIIGWWMEEAPKGPIFTYRGNTISRHLLKERLQQVLYKIGISGEGKRYSPYSGRYTYVTTVKPLLDRATLMMMTGHMDDHMPEHYDRPLLLERARQMQGIRKQLEAL